MSLSVVLFDNFSERQHLLPLVATRPIGNLRVGIWTLADKWAKLFQTDVSYLTVDYLQQRFPFHPQTAHHLLLNAAVLPDKVGLEWLYSLNAGELLLDKEGQWLAAKGHFTLDFTVADLTSFVPVVAPYKAKRLQYPEDIFRYNGEQLNFDFDRLLPQGDGQLNTAAAASATKLYCAATASYKGAILDDAKGPIYIGEEVVIEPGALLIGPVAIGDYSRVKAGAVLYSNVSVGPGCTVGGELSNTVIWGNSNKGHYGYLGCAVIGEGCNLGAGTSNSNLRNDWGTVKLYDYVRQELRDTGLLKCGVVLGDQVMLAINSKINTGTVIGVGAQVAMSNFIPKFVPDFSWITEQVSQVYIYVKFIQMMRRKALAKQEDFSDEEERILNAIFLQTRTERELFINQH